MARMTSNGVGPSLNGLNEDFKLKLTLEGDSIVENVPAPPSNKKKRRKKAKKGILCIELTLE